jgi:hypothetical protein
LVISGSKKVKDRTDRLELSMVLSASRRLNLPTLEIKGFGRWVEAAVFDDLDQPLRGAFT